MSAATVADLFGVAAIILVIVVGFLGAAAATGAAARTKIRTRLGPWGTEAAAVVATVATAGSLWFSEGAHFTPCELCWYQRIAMYPLVVVLWAAVAYRRRGIAEPGLRFVALVLAGAGLAVNLWHNRVETFPESGGGGCDPFNPCTLRWVEGLGFWTIPRLATVCFALILIGVLITPRSALEPTEESPTP